MDSLPDLRPPRQPTVLFPVIRDGLWGFIDRAGALVVEPRYAAALPGTEGLAAVATPPARSFLARLSRRAAPLAWGYIDKSGRAPFELPLIGAGCFSEGFAPAQSAADGQWGLIDIRGQWAIQPRYGAAGEFAEGLAPLFVSRTGMWGYASADERFVVMPKYNSARPFSQGLAAVSYGPKDAGARGSWGYVDAEGEWAIRPHFDDAGDFSDGLAPAKAGPREETYPDRQGLWGYVDSTGAWVMEPRFTKAESFSEGMAFVRLSGEEGSCCRAIRPDGSTAFEVPDGPAMPYSGGLAALCRPRKPVAYIDRAGAIVWPG